MANNITIEIAAEDRERIDKLINALVINGNALDCLAVQVYWKNHDEAEEQKKAPEPVKEEEPVSVSEPVKKEKPAYDRKQIKSLAVKKIQEGYRDEVKNLITSYGYDKIDRIAEDMLPSFVADLEKVGA